MAEVGRQDLFAESIQVSDDEREAVLAPRDDSFVFRDLRVAIHEIIKFRGEPARDVRFAATASRRTYFYPTDTPSRLLVGARAFDGDAAAAPKS